MRRSISFKAHFRENFFYYNPEEYNSWCNGDSNTINSLLNRCGNLGRTKETYFRQAKDKQNYPEVRYAVYLVEKKGFPREGIFYENYTLSLQEIFKMSGKIGLKARGANRLSEVFSQDFFQEFDVLCNKNRDIIAKYCKNVHVDICAINIKSPQVVFSEVKMYKLLRGQNGKSLSTSAFLIRRYTSYSFCKGEQGLKEW